ncbi:MAG: sugar hydrolase [Oscillospiraceae bacterium]|nr:sugar hydrolase [Oscillospiraceae bacterium]
MALISIIEDFHPMGDVRLLDRAAQLTPALLHTIREPVGGFQLKERYSSERSEIVLDEIPHLSMGKGENLCLDFGEHLVGYLTLEFSYSGSHPDAPAYLKLKFAETLEELSENAQDYAGWLSCSWIQEEYVHVDLVPTRLVLPRRYAFRYLKITMMDTSPKYKLIIKHAECRTETSADWRKVPPFRCEDPVLQRIHEVSLKTLANCMQEEFEDGPKRDRRLWMGDLRLQALTNSVSFRNYDLVKRCLYLFGGSRFPDGRVSANIFTKPTVEADDTFLFDYALMFVVALEEYLQETRDEEALDDLYDIAMQQVEYAIRQIGEDGKLNEQAVRDTFIDWSDELDKNACAMGVLIYALRYARRLARRKNDWSQSNWLLQQNGLLRRSALEQFWSDREQCFVSSGQISAASQVWMVLADVCTPEQALAAMRKARSLRSEPHMTTPYMHHYYVMALLRVGMKEEAEEHLKSYWASMLDAGADTFWECWDPEHPEASPYGGSIVNSCCHAWSCTPAYMIEKFLLPAEDESLSSDHPAK